MRICLIGNNLTNYVLANVLAKKEIIVDILGNTKLYKNDSLRTLAISNSNFNYMRKAIKNLNIPSWPSKKIKIYGEKSGQKELFVFENKDKNTFNLIKYKEIFNFFYNYSKKNKKINFIKTNNKKINLNIDKRKYNLIINSDSESNLTKKYFYKNFQKDYHSVAYTSVIKHKKILNNFAIQIFSINGPIAFLPLSAHETSVVFSYNGKKKINEGNVIKIIKKYNSKYQILDFGKFEKFNIKFFMLRKYYYKNVLSFGDLIHRIHPLAGQGFNMTIRDIKILSKIIDEKNNLGLEINSEVAGEFEKKTKHLNYLYGSSVDFIYEFFKIDNKIKNLISKPIFNILNKNKLLNKFATRFSDVGLEI
tara:strand:- start:9635 stop:10723 length:1089 start_codon:yes stop_codon:yes gene_type:complete